MKSSTKTRVIDISKKHSLTHVGSCLSVLPILEDIYKTKKREDKVIMDNAHAHLAHLAVREEYDQPDSSGIVHLDAEDELVAHGIHCEKKAGCDASGGSLGHGIGIGIGYALAKPNTTVHVTVSDGSMMEGSNWEALRILDSLKLDNVKIYCNFNGYSALDEVDFYTLKTRMSNFVKGISYFRTDNGLPQLEGLKGHYDKI